MGPTGICVATFILFLIPWSILGGAWTGSLEEGQGSRALELALVLPEGSANCSDARNPDCHGFLFVVDAHQKSSWWDSAPDSG